MSYHSLLVAASYCMKIPGKRNIHMAVECLLCNIQRNEFSVVERIPLTCTCEMESRLHEQLRKMSKLHRIWMLLTEK